jgi:uncharacterized protein YjbI with pentapeptide repeats
MDDRDEVLELLAEGNVEDAVLEHVDLTGTKLGPLELVGVTVRDTDLSNSSLQQLVARRVTFQTCRAIGLRLSVDHAQDLSFVDSRLDYATMHIEKVRGAMTFTGCTFKEATIAGDLSKVSFQDCDFVDTEFRARSAVGCDLRSSRVTSARGLLTLRGAKITADQAVSVSMLIAAEAGLVIED